ncbi:MAG: glycosyltransferase [Candidatus Gottesmanbacteria bacterium]|nr:glycosyltransferase [Candidatus Gottesmanbacteria bacterium]
MNRETGETIYARLPDVDTSWMRTFNTDMIHGFEQNGVNVRVIPERGRVEGQQESDIFAHRLRLLENFSQMTISDKDILFVSCPLRCSLDQLVWVAEVVKEKSPLIACYTLTGAFIEDDWITLFTPWVSNLEKVWYEKSDLIFVPTDYFKRSMLEHGYDGSKIFVVGAPVDSEKISAYSQPRDYNTVIFNHRLNEDKKPEYFLRMVDDLSLQYPNLRFYISTNLNDKDFWHSMDEDLHIKLKEALSKNKSLSVVFNSSREEYFGLLNRAYLAPCFSTHETFGFSVAESLAAGCIPVVPARLTYPELVDSETDFLYSSTGDLENDYQAALQRMLYFIQHPEFGEKKSIEARSLVERFRPKTVLGKILQIMDTYTK